MMSVCIGCEWQLKTADSNAEDEQVSIDRYDRIESLYLTTGDYSALQQMNTGFPQQTRMLIEDMLHIGKVDDPDINTKFLHFFQDSTLQRLLTDVELQYDDIDDLNKELSAAFKKLKEELHDIEIPKVYTQIGSFDQSIVIGNKTLGISLDKYLGRNYPFYQQHYTEHQRQMMVRQMIVPDCMAFYLLSLYPQANPSQLTQQQRDEHMGRIQWVVNKLVGRTVFDNAFVTQADHFMKNNSKTTIHQLLSNIK